VEGGGGELGGSLRRIDVDAVVCCRPRWKNGEKAVVRKGTYRTGAHSQPLNTIPLRRFLLGVEKSWSLGSA